MTFADAGSPARRDYAAIIGLCAIGAAMLAFVAASPWISRVVGYAFFSPTLALSGLMAIAATRLVVNVPARAAVVIVLLFALAMRLAAIGADPLMSTDVYRYIWDGRVQAAGINPYLYVPADPVLAALRDAAIFPNINRADYAVTAYPPFAEMFFFLVTRFTESLIGMRLAMVACEAVIVVVMIDLLRRLRFPVGTVVAYAWHPLPIFEIANNGHVEALMVALMMVGVWLLVRARRLAGAIAIALAAVVKPYAVVVLPAFWRASSWKNWDWRAPLAVIVTILVCYAPYLGAGRGVFGYAGGYLSEEGLLRGDGLWLTGLVQVVIGDFPGLTLIYGIAAAVIMLWLGLRISFRGERTGREKMADIIVLLTVGLLLISPNYPWYFLALVPLVPLGGGAPIWALTLGAFLLYRPVFLPENDLAWKTIAMLPFIVALAFVIRARRTRAPVAPSRVAAWSGRKPVVSVVIPCLNEEEPIAGVVAEVLAQGVDEVIVVDNGSTDATAERARSAGARVLSEPQRGYGRACATGVAAIRPDAEIVCFLDGDGSDVPSFLSAVVTPLAAGEADFVMGSRLRGNREPGSMTAQQLVAGYLAGFLMRMVYGVHFTDMSPFRAMRVAQLRGLGMSEVTYGWNLEMQMRVAASGIRVLEIPVDHRCRRGGVSKVSGNLVAGLSAAWKIATTFLRLALTLRREPASAALHHVEDQLS